MLLCTYWGDVMQKFKIVMTGFIFLATFTYYTSNQIFQSGIKNNFALGNDIKSEVINNVNYIDVAQTDEEEWICEDSAFPKNCNNGTCCETSAYCCSTHCCPSGSLCCPTGCCPSGYPWFCPENNRCYENSEEASVNCPSILQQCNWEKQPWLPNFLMFCIELHPQHSL